MSAIEVAEGTTWGYALLERLSLLGWASVVTADGKGGIILTIGQGDAELVERGRSVAEAAPKLYERAIRVTV